jgi:hypothetical protein
MNEDTLQRLLYYKGQLLTAQDFDDQQNYHIQKLEQLTQRFPNGIVRGLTVIFSTNSDGSEALKILGGLAIDADGKAIVVPNEGILVPLPNGLEKPFLSIKYTESKSRRSISLLEPSKPFDRVVEKVEPIWSKNANILDEGKACITVAKLRVKTEADKTLLPEVLGSNHVIEGEGDPTIRLDASQIGTDQIKDKVVTTKKINDGAVTTEKLADNIESTPRDTSVTTAKLADDAVTTVKIHDGAVTSAKLDNNVQATPRDTSVTTAKLADDAVTTVKIHDHAVTSAKVEIAVDTDPAKGIQSENIAKGAVTSNKLKIIEEITHNGPKSVKAGDKAGPFNIDIGPNEIFNVIPTSAGGPLSWTTQVQYHTGTVLRYSIVVKNEQPTGTNPPSAVGFKIIKINLGGIS